MPTEVEAKFLAEPEAMRALAGATRLGAAELGPLRSVDEIDRYLDTADGRLAAVRWACRLRQRGDRWSVSLKGPKEADAGSPAWLHARPELEGAASAAPEPGTWPASVARDRLVSMSGDEPLVERLRLVQRRGERHLSLDEQPIGTLSLDEVDVHGPDGMAGSFGAVELELAADGRRQALDDVARAMAEVPGLVPDPLSKLEHALALLRR
jgi:inorganic triphosphatase YgiF